jgi:P-type Ca2+ transporter type 2C
MVFKGLSAQEALDKLQKEGKNKISYGNQTTIIKKLIHQVSDLMVIILIGASALSFFLGEGVDASIILGIVLINAIIGFFQEWKSEKTIEALKKMISPMAIGVRDGKEQEIPAEDLVLGDIIIIREGDRIPADAEIIENFDLKVEEAALSGESSAVEKNISEKIFLGTACVYGSATAKVIATGMKTEFGKIAHLATKTKEDLSPIQKELLHIGIFVGKVTFVIVSILFLINFFKGEQTLLDSLLFSISVAVAAVPEGLPATVTIALALGVQRLAKKKAIVRQLSSVETLGSATVICSDKTGTLTKNEMTVVQGGIPQGDGLFLFEIEGVGYAPQGTIKIQNPTQLKNSQLLFSIAQVCNDAKLSFVESESKWKIFGDPTEGALLAASEKYFQAFEEGKEERISRDSILRKFPFDSTRKRMSVLLKTEKGIDIFTKGAPESILDQCSSVLIEGNVIPLTEELKKTFLQTAEKLSEKALRILGFAFRSFPILPEEEIKSLQVKEAETDLVFVGFLGMIDPAREEVPEAVLLCKKAGIRTIIITGDNALTAKAIAEKIGFFDLFPPRIITGKEIKEMSDEELQEILKKEAKNIPLFARSSPEDKMRIVSMLQKLGEIVAVTGDGVNDAPALKKADIGIAMGSGTEVAKESANIVLLDDSFASIIKAVREGRTISQNLEKFVWFIFSGNFGELLLIFCSMLLNTPVALTAIMILIVDLGTDVLPSIALGVDDPKKDIMDAPPKDPKKRILTRRFAIGFARTGFLIGGSAFIGFLWILFTYGWTWGEGITNSDLHRKAMTMSLTILIFGQLFNTFSARSYKESAFHPSSPPNSMFWWAIGISTIMTLLVLYLPLANTLFKTIPLSPKEFGIAILLASIAFWIEEIRKLRMQKRDPFQKK